HTTAPASITASHAAGILNRDSQCPLWRSRTLSVPGVAVYVVEGLSFFIFLRATVLQNKSAESATKDDAERGRKNPVSILQRRVRFSLQGLDSCGHNPSRRGAHA